MGPIVDGPAFHERLLLPPVVQWAVRVLAVLLMGVTVVALLSEPWSTWEQLLGVVLGLGIPLLMLTVHGQVQVRDGTLRLALHPFWRRSLPLGEVYEVRPGAVDPLREIGVLGLGRTRGGRRVLALRRGPAVHLRTRDGRRCTVGVQDPDALVQALGGTPPEG